MRLRRLLHGLMVVGLVVLLMPVVFVVIVIAVVLAVVIGIKDLAVELWNELPRNRRALARAREALASHLPGRVAREWHVARRDRHKCFVQATLTGMTNPPTLWLCAVWDGGQVDDLGTWQFHHGLGIRHAVKAYERFRVTGQAWPTGLSELVEKVPAAELPAAARPGVHPHEGSVLIHHQGQITFYAYAEMVGEGITPVEAKEMEAFDAEGRRLRLGMPIAEGLPVVLAPFPPTPPDKVFIERLRHFLLGRTNDDATRERLRGMLPAELADHGLQTLGEVDPFDGEAE